MRTKSRDPRRLLAALACFVPPLAGVGCQSQYQLQTPVALQSPFPGERTWAVAPLANESGVSAVEPLVLTDSFVIEIDEANGLRCIPLNRTMLAMRALGLKAIVTDADARALLDTLQVDGLLVGSITAYDPYRPLQLGIAAQLYTLDQPTRNLDSPESIFLSMGEGGRRGTGESGSPRSDLAPSSQFSQVYDGRNHEILRKLDVYARARAAPQSGFRDGIYLATIEAFSRFVAYDVTAAILAKEASNVAERAAEAAAQATPHPSSGAVQTARGG